MKVYLWKVTNHFQRVSTQVIVFFGYRRWSKGVSWSFLKILTFLYPTDRLKTEDAAAGADSTLNTKNRRKRSGET